MADRTQLAEGSVLGEFFDVALKATLALTGVSRLYCMYLPREGDLVAKEERARAAWFLMDGACRLLSYLREGYGLGRKSLLYYTEKGQAAAALVAHDDTSVALQCLADSETHLVGTLNHVRNAASHDLLGAMRGLLTNIVQSLPSHLQGSSDPAGPIQDNNLVAISSQPATTIRRTTGPRRNVLDAAFTRALSPTDAGNPPFDGEPGDTLRFFWTLAAREGMAADLAALNVAEYDYLPVEYYRDFAKQAWDESLHARFYLGAVPEVFAVLRNHLDHGSPEYREVTSYLTKGTALSLPYEGTCYVSVWNASLEERLTLMNLRTEAPSIRSKRMRIESALCQNLPNLRLGIALDAFDEKNHARFGVRWLRYLHPDTQVRREKVANADMLRGFLMALTLADLGGTPASDVIVDLCG